MSQQLTDESLQQIKKNLPPDELAVFQLLLSDYHSKLSQVEEMQKTLVEIANMRPSICTWSDEEYYENFSKCEEIAQQTLQSLKGDKP